MGIMIEDNDLPWMGITSWVRQFIESRGLQVITNVIGMLNRREIK